MTLPIPTSQLSSRPKRRLGRAPGVSVDVTRLRSVRSDRGLTQEELAWNAGISVRSYQNAEAGHRISTGLVQDICAALDCAYEELVTSALQSRAPVIERAGLAPLPPAPHWLERPRAHAQVTEVWRREPVASSCCLLGSTGVGTSALARQLAVVALQRFSGGVIWLHARAATTSENARTLFAYAGTVFGASANGTASNRSTLSEQRSMFWHCAAASRCVVILDGVRDLVTARLLLETGLAANVLVTTPDRSVADLLAGHTIAVERLTEDDSLRLFRRILTGGGRRGEDHELAELVGLLGGIPRHIVVAAEILRREMHTTVAALVTRVRSMSPDFPAAAPRSWLLQRDLRQFFGTASEREPAPSEPSVSPVTDLRPRGVARTCARKRSVADGAHRLILHHERSTQLRAQ